MPERKSDKELLADLLAKGYGEDEKRKRRERSSAARRRGSALREKRKGLAGAGPELRRRSAEEPEPASGAQRMEDTLAPLPPALRRRIDSYAWRGGFLATGVGERARSFLTIVAPRLEDWASRGLMRQLVGLPGGDPSDPASCSLLDAIPMLGSAARLLLGGERTGGGERAGPIRRPDEARIGDRIASSLRVREPFLLPLLGRLAETDPMAVQALEFTRIAYRRGDRVRTRSLVRPVRYVYRLGLATEKLESQTIGRLAATAAEINRAHEADAAGRRRVENAAVAAGVLVGRIREFRHELFPLLLKCLGLFFTEESLWDSEHLQLVCDFVDLRPDDLLDYSRAVESGRRPTWQPPVERIAAAEVEAGEAAQAADTQAPASQGTDTDAGEAPRQPAAADAADAAADEAAGQGSPAGDPFSARFGRLLETLRDLFPESGIHRLQQYHFVLPYFDLRVFSKDLSFPASVQLLPRNDPMSQIMVLHRIIDNLISSVNSTALGEVTSAAVGYREGLSDLVRRWKEVYTSLFDPYLKQIEDHVRVTEVDSRSPTARRMEDTLNRMRNHAIRHFGRVIAGAGRLDIAAMPLYSLAEQLASECRQLGGLLSARLIAEKNRQAVALLDAIAERNVVDLEVNSYKPTIVRLKRLLERQLGRPIDRSRVHLAFFEILFDIAALYDWLLNDRDSFFRTPPDGPLHAGVEEHRRWASARQAAARGAEPHRALAARASPESWAQDFASRFEALRRAGRITFVLAELIGREVLEAEGEVGALALAATANPARGAEAPVAVSVVGHDHLLLVTTRPSRAAVAWVDIWRSQAAGALKKHSVYADVLEQNPTPGIGSLLVAVADVSDCARPLDALARARAVLAATRTGVGPIAVWHEGEAIGLDDYLARVVASRP